MGAMVRGYPTIGFDQKSLQCIPQGRVEEMRLTWQARNESSKHSVSNKLISMCARYCLIAHRDRSRL